MFSRGSSRRKAVEEVGGVPRSLYPCGIAAFLPGWGVGVLPQWRTAFGPLLEALARAPHARLEPHRHPPAGVLLVLLVLLVLHPCDAKCFTGVSTLDSRMSRRLNVRLDPERYDAWKAVATSSGMSLSEYVIRSVEDRIAGRTAEQISERTAAKVLVELLPEMERVVHDAVGGASPEPQPQVVYSAPSFTPPVVSVGPRTWDPQCDDADLHVKGRVCASCGGSAQYVVR